MADDLKQTGRQDDQRINYRARSFAAQCNRQDRWSKTCAST
jgi:hypothetical protein